ncbi:MULTISPECIES: efflux RND transporter periplasmic adaptor subunit [unclassified Massilia]|uniref:efflux RND transporter periplasmic adaptor subunit n=1 Tax=unclassified Massilia TaxID=2609279 RepID=UPI0009E837F8|nr:MULTISPECIES: efflux RND transporter periplasmic adaptor subunit [unclassified Massilia]
MSTQPTSDTKVQPATRTRLVLQLGLKAAIPLIVVGIAVSAPGLLHYQANGQATEDAFVEGNLVQVTPQTSGTVTRIAADNTDVVTAGETLVQLDRLDAQLALDRAEASLSKAARQVRAQFANVAQLRANVVLRQADLTRAESDLARRRGLVESGAVSGEDLRHAEDAAAAARAALSAAREQVSAAQSLVEGTSVNNHPDVLAAIAQVRDATVALSRTSLAAPVGGIVARRNVQIGQRVAQGAPLMAIVPLNQLWVTANLKENQLKDVRLGQPVAMTTDVYGDRVVFHGRVVGQEAGTGSAFAAAPAQNATGNWIKVVQRVPVRIALDPAEVARHPLRLGLSMRAEIDTSTRSGPGLMQGGNHRQQYDTRVFEREDAGAEAVVARVLGNDSGRETAAR